MRDLSLSDRLKRRHKHLIAAYDAVTYPIQRLILKNHLDTKITLNDNGLPKDSVKNHVDLIYLKYFNEKTIEEYVDEKLGRFVYILKMLFVFFFKWV